MDASEHYKESARLVDVAERMLTGEEKRRTIQHAIVHALLALAAPRVVAVGQIGLSNMDLVWSDGTVTQYDW